MNFLVRALQDNPCPSRVDWFTDVRSCRRRAQSSWQSAPIANVFSMADQYVFLEGRAIRYRIRSLIKSRGLFVEDAFRAMNVGGTSRRRDCHSAAPPSNFSRCFNSDGERASAK